MRKKKSFVTIFHDVRAIMCLLFFLLPSMSVMGQKKEIQAARDLVKQGKDLSSAQASMEKLLKDSVNRGNKKIWNVLYDAVAKQYEQGNEKLYLKQKYDTASWFMQAKMLFDVAQKIDSIDALPDKKGRVVMEFRKSHSGELDKIRKNLYIGGTWFIRQQKFSEAYNLYDAYIESASAPLLGDYQYRQKDSKLSEAAYWAVYCGYKMKDTKATLHHAYEALKDTAHYEYMLQYLAETYKLEKDTLRYEQILNEGFRHSPKFPFFFPRLVEFYINKNLLDSALVVVDRALRVAPDEVSFLYAKSTVLLNMGKNQECLDICKKLLEKNDSLPELYYNAGIACFNMALEQTHGSKMETKKQGDNVALYKKARPYLEKYRSMEPTEQGKWGLPLYTIYLNLNMGKEFDEIDKILRH